MSPLRVRRALISSWVAGSLWNIIFKTKRQAGTRSITAIRRCKIRQKVCGWRIVKYMSTITKKYNNLWSHTKFKCDSVSAGAEQYQF